MKPLLMTLFWILLMHPLIAQAAPGCMLIISYPDGKMLYKEGDCTARYSPASTFKIPLALMGFDSGVLKDTHAPAIPYKEDYNGYENQRKTTDPTIWEKESIVWYSQRLTRTLGAVKFQHYVDQFAYGNRDLSGNPGQNDGLTRSWLSSSLEISPAEQIDFLKKLLDGELGVSDHAYDMTKAIMPRFSTKEWHVSGKTGTGLLKDAKGIPDNNKPLGWFVGWAENKKRKIVFAKLILGDATYAEPAGPKAREQFLSQLPDMFPSE